MSGCNLDKENKRLRLVVVLALQNAGGFLNVALSGCKACQRSSSGQSNGAEIF